MSAKPKIDWARIDPLLDTIPAVALAERFGVSADRVRKRKQRRDREARS